MRPGILLLGFFSLCSTVVQAFEAVALVDSLDFAKHFDVERDSGNIQVLEHVLKTHATDIWWRDKGGGLCRYPSRAESWPISEYPFDKHTLPNEDTWGHLRLGLPRANAFPRIRRECAKRGLGFGIHTTLEESHKLISTTSGWTLSHPQYWSRMRNAKPWLGCCALGYPEVVEHKLEMVDERLELGPQVIFLDFSRDGGYFTGREFVKPVTDEWRRIYGCEPPEDYRDPRWLKLVSGKMTGYLRRFSGKCHEKGCRFAIGFKGMDGSGSVNLYEKYGVDWTVLAADGTIDALVVMGVRYDKSDVWRSTERIYRGIMEHRGNADVYFPLSAYNFSGEGYPAYAKAANVSEAEAAARLIRLAKAVGARGIVMECVDYGNYSPAVCSEIGRSLAKVDPFIGTSGVGHVTPAAACPFGLVLAGPDTSARSDAFVADWAHSCGYQFADEWLWRFSQTHLSGTGCLSFGDVGILPIVDGFDGIHRPARLIKRSERAEPGFYRVDLDEDGSVVSCEAAALPHVAVYRLRYPKGARAKLLFDLDWGIGNVWKRGCWGKRVLSGTCTFPSATEVRGGREVWNWNDYRIFFSAAFSAPVVNRLKMRDFDGVRGAVYELDFGNLADGLLELKIGLSMRSEDGAVKNLAAEAPQFGFDAVRTKGEAAWCEALSRLEPSADTPSETSANFRSALYRTMLQPNLVSDVGEQPRYSTFSLWDTFRAAHPLYTVIAPERVSDFVRSLLEQRDRQGYLPIWALGGSENHCMIGHHSVPVIVDAFLKGVATDVDWEKVYLAVKDSLTVNHRAVNEGTWGLTKEDWDLLDRYGYYPFDLLRGEYGGKKVLGESVARLLECAYDDACAARMAETLGKKEDADFFRRRAANWRNAFDPSVGFMRGKDSRGRWREPFDPYALGGGPWTDNDFCEGNAWQYTWHVLHDPKGLIAAFGGRKPFVDKLRQLFEQSPRAYANRPTADVTGLIGQYAHGNEPSHHTAYFFTLAGRNDLTAECVRAVFDTQYAPRPDGLCGNDDCGQMGAWYLFSAMGFYPFNPCGGEYVIGAPQIPKVTLNLANGKTFTMTAKNLSKENKYVKLVMLNGKPIRDWKIRHADIMKGGELVFEMGATK